MIIDTLKNHPNYMNISRTEIHHLITFILMNVIKFKDVYRIKKIDIYFLKNHTFEIQIL